MGNEIDLLQIKRGSITAPAGCGKTQLITAALARHADKKPILVLTHTNAGVIALRSRLKKTGVNPHNFSIATIDGWAMKLVSKFPKSSGIEPEILRLKKPSSDYTKIREGALFLLKSGAVDDAISSSYFSLIVDEYQDCSVVQHSIVLLIAKLLNTVVLGDPLQAIFGFGSDALPDWDNDVCKKFPSSGELKTPWRWINSKSDELGYWLLEVRNILIRGESIDLSYSPEAVGWVELNGDADDFQKSLKAARTRAPSLSDKTLVIGDSINPLSRYKIASLVHGATTVEAVDLRDLSDFSRGLDLHAADVLGEVASFAQKMMTNVGAVELIKRVRILSKGTGKKSATVVECAALDLKRTPSFLNVAKFLEVTRTAPDVRVYRPTVLNACLKALHLASNVPDLSFEEAVVQVREQNRYYGRELPRRAVGSTLLLKGLEAESVIVLDADQLNRKNLYVAMTRGSKALTICSRTLVLNPRK